MLERSLFKNILRMPKRESTILAGVDTAVLNAFLRFTESIGSTALR